MLKISSIGPSVPILKYIPTQDLLREIAERSSSAILAVNFHGSEETQVLGHGRRCECLGLVVMASEAIEDDDTGRAELKPFPGNPPPLIESKLIEEVEEPQVIKMLLA